MKLNEILILKYPNVNFRKEIILQDDGNGTYIKYWDPSLGSIPSQEQLDLWAIELEPIKFAKEQRENRRREYPAIGDQLDAMLKYFSTKQDLNTDLELIKNQWATVKTKYPLVK